MNVIRSGSSCGGRELVGDPADRDELARAQQRDRLLVADPLAVERLREDVGDRAGRRRSRFDLRSRCDEAQLGHVVELADVARHLEEGVEPGALARPERVAELLEVAREDTRPGSRNARSPRGRAAPARRARAGRTRRARARARRRRRRPAPAPPRPRRPSAAPSARARAGRGRSAGSDPRTRFAAPRRRSAASRRPLSSERHVDDVREQHLRQHDRRRALGRHRDRADLRRTACARRAGSSRPRPRTRRTSAAGSAATTRCRAYSIDEIGARSSWPSRSIRFSSVGTPGPPPPRRSAGGRRAPC